MRAGNVHFPVRKFELTAWPSHIAERISRDQKPPHFGRLDCHDLSNSGSTLFNTGRYSGFTT